MANNNAGSDRSFSITPGHEREEAKRGPRPQSFGAPVPETTVTSTPAIRSYQEWAFQEFMGSRDMAKTPENQIITDPVMPPTPRPAFARLATIPEDRPLNAFWDRPETPESQMSDNEERLTLTQPLTAPTRRVRAPVFVSRNFPQ